MGKVLARGSSVSIAVEATQNVKTRKHVVATLGRLVRKELQTLCSERVNSIQRTRSAKSLKEFGWSGIIEEAREHAPTLVQLLTSLTRKNDRSTELSKAQLGAIGMMLSVMCKIRNPRMMLFQRVMSVILYAGHSAKQVSNSATASFRLIIN